jgi:sigma-B regulation protein RsbU (phosphoserine phosphatase)
VAEDRHKYEQELLAQRRRAEELAEQHARDQEALAAAGAEARDRALFAEQLVGMVSHDIRNPLSVIDLSTLLLRKGGLSPAQQTVVDRVSRSVSRVQHLIGDLLDFTQARLGGGLTVRPEPADLHQAVADAVAELAAAFPDRAIVHRREGDGQCVADARRITQAVGNLVANAVAHGASGRPIAVHTGPAGADFHVRVHNEGPVIPADALPTLFQPMVRGPGKLGGEGGVGLGLYIVERIVQAHGGSVQVRSSAQEGTSFTLALPRAGPP